MAIARTVSPTAHCYRREHGTDQVGASGTGAVGSGHSPPPPNAMNVFFIAVDGAHFVVGSMDCIVMGATEWPIDSRGCAGLGYVAPPRALQISERSLGARSRHLRF